MRLAHFPHNKLNVRAASPRVRAAREGEGSEHQTRSGGMPCSSRASKRKRNMDTLHTRRFGRVLALGWLIVVLAACSVADSAVGSAHTAPALPLGTTLWT